MNLFNCIGGFSFRNFAYANIVAGLFSWFVLHNTDATVFFGIASLISLCVWAHLKSTTDRFDEVYRQIDDNARGNERERESMYRYIDENIRDMQDAQKSKR